MIKKVIPCIDIKDGKAVKGVNFEDVKEVGSILELAVKYAQAGADELFLLDISGAIDHESSQRSWVKEVIKAVDIPLTIGGGITTVEDAAYLLGLGISKVSIGSAALNNPDFLKQLTTQFGSEAIVSSIDAKKVDGQWMVFGGGGQQKTGKELMAWAKEVERLGVGSILFTSIDHDGSQAGYAVEALAKLKEAVSIPIIASGGAGKLSHFVEACNLGKADAVLAASLFHFDIIEVAQLKFALRAAGVEVDLASSFKNLTWDSNGMIPAIIQDVDTDLVLMLGYMTEESLSKTLETGKVTFYSRSRQKLWTKGEESGNFLNLMEMRVDCDRDALLVKAKPQGPTCHLGSATCWRENKVDKNFLFSLESLLKERVKSSPEESYTASLFAAGKEKMAQKVGEEAVELVIEALGNNNTLFLNEAADLMYHYLVLLLGRGFSLADVIYILEKRRH